ncbi:jg25091 [Pararge aegeria aegeria]|uniref:Jg25091 protein n=1 Tax=Pararge aegeria aegeria TaxID=348720 RepID=A0A8S4S7K7_9NEOP|nr:jg25091 [Pararge aegeria aegeria]
MHKQQPSQSTQLLMKELELLSNSHRVPETSNVLWNLARYFRFLFGIPESPLSAPSMTMPMYALPQMHDMQGMQDMQDMQSQMFSPTMAMPSAQ